VKYFEETYNCSGLCKTPLFYWMKPLSDGRPENPCIIAVWGDVRHLLD